MTVVLVVIGLIMVLSASSVKSLVQTDNGTPYLFFRKQLEFAAVGAVAMVVAAHVPRPRVWKALACRSCSVRWSLQAPRLHPARRVASTATATGWRSARSPLQPSEFAKIGLVLVGATVLSAQAPLARPARHVVVPVPRSRSPP